MSELVLMKVDKWMPPIKSKMLTSTAIDIKVLIEDADKDLNQMVTKQKTAFDAAWKSNQKKFDADVLKLGKTKVKAVQDAVDWTEQQIAKKATKKDQDEVVATANKMLDQAWKVYEYELQKLGQKYYEEAVEKSYQVMKMKIVKAQAKAIAKIVVVVAFALAATGIGIAASVVTGGAAAPIAIAAALASFKLVYSTYKAVDQNWINSEKQMAIIRKDVDTLSAAAGKLQEQRALATTGHEAALATVKKLKAAISGKMVDLDKHVGQLDKFIVQTSVAVKKQNDELNKVSNDLNKAGDPEAQKKANKLMYDLMQSIGALRAMDDVRVAAAEVKKAWDKEEQLNVTRLDPALRKLGDAAPFLMQVKDGAVGLADPIKKLAKALN